MQQFWQLQNCIVTYTKKLAYLHICMILLGLGEAILSTTQWQMRETYLHYYRKENVSVTLPRNEIKW